MDNALQMALEQAALSGARRVRMLRLRVGSLSGVVPDALQFAFEILTPDTAAAGAELSIEQVSARFWCADCQAEFPGEELFAECPNCHHLSQELRAGRELELAALEVC